MLFTTKKKKKREKYKSKEMQSLTLNITVVSANAICTWKNRDEIYPMGNQPLFYSKLPLMSNKIYRHQRIHI